MQNEPQSPGARLRSAWATGPLLIPGVFNALVARMAERAGFRAVYQSGAALSAGLAAVPDIGLLAHTEFAEQGRLLAQAVGIPVLSDADTGFGEALTVERTVRLYESAGLAGLHLEDQQLPKRCGHLSGKNLVPIDEMVGKLNAALFARRDKNFVIIARTDARSVEGFSAAVDRAKAYVDAGADMIFPESLETPDEFAHFAQEVSVPLMANMTEFGRSPLLSLDELGAMGYAAILCPVTIFRVAMQAAENALSQLFQEGTQRDFLGKMQTRAQLYDLLNYDDVDERDRGYFGDGSSTKAEGGKN